MRTRWERRETGTPWAVRAMASVMLPLPVDFRPLDDAKVVLYSNVRKACVYTDSVFNMPKLRAFLFPKERVRLSKRTYIASIALRDRSVNFWDRRKTLGQFRDSVWWAVKWL